MCLICAFMEFLDGGQVPREATSLFTARCLCKVLNISIFKYEGKGAGFAMILYIALVRLLVHDLHL